MRRTRDLVALSRRDFCGLACAGLIWSACTDGDRGPIQTGGLGDDTGGSGDPDRPDAGGVNPPHDAPETTPDAAQAMGTCTGGETDVGTAGTFVSGTPKYFATGKFFVVRDAMGLYAVSAKCTHEGATNTVSSGHFRCPKHGALFQFDGSIISGPVSKPLVHYSMCTLDNGNVAVDITKQVTAATRLDV